MFYPFYYDKTMLILIPAVIIAFWAQSKVSSTYRKYREQRMANGYTGEQVARMILDGAGLYNVPVLLTEGELSDHYDPSKRVIKLSRDIFYGNSIAAAGVAAHEVGHAIQHQKAYKPLVLRTSIATGVNVASQASMDYYEIDADKANEYISHLDGVKAFAGGSKEEQLEQIITQKWIAVFPNGNEGWAEVRRTDYPRYLLAPVNGNNSNGEVASGKLIKRINYPNSESRNPNKPGNVNQGSRVWWDVTDTMNDRGQWHTPNNFR